MRAWPLAKADSHHAAGDRAGRADAVPDRRRGRRGGFLILGGRHAAVHQVRTTYGTNDFAVTLVIVAGAVAVSDEPDDWDRLRSPVTMAGAAQAPSRVGGVVAVTMIPTQ
jgi:hypothetical protein